MLLHATEIFEMSQKGKEMLKAQLRTSETLGFLFPSEGSLTHLFSFMEAVLMQGVEKFYTPMHNESPL